MPIRHACLAGLLGSLGFASAAALAQAAPTSATRPDPAAPSAPAQSAADVVNPTAFVPAVPYRSVFVDTPTGVENEQADWKKANSEVGQFKRGHVDVLKWEADQAARQKMEPAAPARGAKP